MFGAVDRVFGAVDRVDHQDLSFLERNLGAILAWFSLIHCEPAELRDVLTEFRRVVRRGGMLVVGFFEGDCAERFDHKVAPAYRRPVDDMSRMLSAVGFAETERRRRAGTAQTRPYAALAARAGTTPTLSSRRGMPQRWPTTIPTRLGDPHSRFPRGHRRP